ARVAVLRARVVHRVPMVLHRHLGELLLRGAVPLHVLAPTVTEHARRDGWPLLRLLVVLLLESRELRVERALLHLLEAEGENALVHPRRDRLVGEMERTRPGRAVAVHVEDGNAAEPHRVERALPLAAHAVHVAGEGLLELGRLDTGHSDRLADGLVAEVGEVALAPLELRHPDPDHTHIALAHENRSSVRFGSDFLSERRTARATRG